MPAGVDCGYVTDADGREHFPATHYQLNIGSQPFLKVNRKGERFVNESLPMTPCAMRPATSPAAYGARSSTATP